jgi:hypothetical protein
MLGVGFRYSRVVLRCEARLQALVVEGTQWNNNFGFLKIDWHCLKTK